MTAQEDGSDGLADDLLLARAGELGRVLFSQDQDLIIEAVRLQRGGQEFSGVIYTHQRRMSHGECIDELELLAVCLAPEDMRNRLEYLPYT